MEKITKFKNAIEARFSDHPDKNLIAGYCTGLFESLNLGGSLQPQQGESVEIKHDLNLDVIKTMISELSDEERMAVFGDYCTHCGCNDPYCRCWDDS